MPCGLGRREAWLGCLLPGDAGSVDLSSPIGRRKIWIVEMFPGFQGQGQQPKLRLEFPTQAPFPVKLTSVTCGVGDRKGPGTLSPPGLLGLCRMVHSNIHKEG